MKALRRTVFWQSGAVILCGLVSWVAAGSVAGISSLLGGLVCALPSFNARRLTDAFVSESASPSVSNLLIRIHKSVAGDLRIFQRRFVL